MRASFNVASFPCVPPRAGALAGAITGVATTPLDVVKTRLMTQGTNKVYSGVYDCVRKIWQEEGSAAFLRVSHVSLICHAVVIMLVGN